MFLAHQNQSNLAIPQLLAGNSGEAAGAESASSAVGRGWDVPTLIKFHPNNNAEIVSKHVQTSDLTFHKEELRFELSLPFLPNPPTNFQQFSPCHGCHVSGPLRSWSLLALHLQMESCDNIFVWSRTPSAWQIHHVKTVKTLSERKRYKNASQLPPNVCKTVHRKAGNWPKV